MKSWLLLLATCGLALAQPAAPADLGNLSFVKQKLLAGQPIRVGFLGGSITQGAGTPKHGDCYYWLTRLRLVSYAKEHGSALETALAAVGGTGTEYGVFRVGSQLLDKDIDLLVVEFAVNDLNNPAALDGMEGIVRQALSRNSHLAVVIFDTATLAALQNYYDKGTKPPSVAAFHEIAEHYHLLEIEAGPAVQAAFQAGTYTPETFFSDKVHPTKEGHAFYADFLSAALIQALNAAPATPPATAALPPPLGSGILTGAKLLPITPLTKSDDWAAVPPNYYTYFGSWKTTTPGASLTFTAKGRRILLLCGKVSGLRVSGENLEERVLHAPGRPGGIPTLQLIYDGPQEISIQITVTLEPDPQGSPEAELAGLATVTTP